MSNYRNFVSDFPQRCDDLLRHFFHEANARKRDVTLMLTVATAGFVMPFERLRPLRRGVHPTRDRERHEEAAQSFDAMLRGSFSESAFWDELDSAHWFYAAKVENENRDLDAWPELQDPQAVSLTE